ncbi:choice-of-anchor L domain-containing protein [Flavobacterium phycosphaerae]|uniref:choice-of-anchor L domain-containing protein n=1 Tax=Flavobacterium phycosphaerae TaxID=2697515 RepID=UPI001389835E|nr:choice-of-anchor L domain-containing protein [Flavobacterium phycosphaerae]
MKRILLPLFLFLIGYNSFAQPITTNTTTYTIPQLVQDVLFAAPPDDGGSACVGTVSNITWRTDAGTNLPNNNKSIGYFQNTNPNFPLSKGIIMSTGFVANAPGPNTTTQGNGIWGTDNDLFNYIDGLNIDTGLTDYNDATVLEFDFTPLTNTMSFDFLFASEEYGTFQCSYSDAFAFFLTNVTAATPPTNLALIPSSTTPISVVTIRDNAYNNSCSSVNPLYFGNYNGGANAASAATNFNGETVLMTASSTVIPNNVYHIKLVIADRNDNNYDSAVFLGGGSFNIGSPTIDGVGDYAGLNSFSGPDAVCGSAAVTVQAGAVPISGVTYSWTLDGDPIVGATTYSYTMTDAGNYCVTLTYPSGCFQTDCTLVEHIPSLAIGSADDLYACPSSPTFNLTQNTVPVLNGLSTNLSYHHSLVDAQNLSGSISNPANYIGYDGEVIYVAVEDPSTPCITTTQFTLHLQNCFTNPTAGTPPNMIQYETTLNSGVSAFNLNSQTAAVLGSYNPADYTVTYYLTQADADAGTNPIDLSVDYINGSNPQTIFIRLEENAAPAGYYATTSFSLIVVALPTVSISGTISICSGTTTTITFNGTPNADVTYTVDGGPNQTITLNGAGTATLPTLC